MERRMETVKPLRRCGDAGGRNSWGEPCRRVPADGKMFCTLHDPNVVRCSGTNADGQPCGREPILGGRSCMLHGSGTRDAKRAARNALFEANFAALRYLREAIEANDRYLAFKAAAHITRLANATRIEVEHTGGGPPAWLRWLPLDRRAQLAEWVNDARAAMARGEPPIDARQPRLTDGTFTRPDTNVVDAEPIDAKEAVRK